jgi:hypothetical protein
VPFVQSAERDSATRARPTNGSAGSPVNPRADDWSGHFVLNLDTFAIEGLTPTGRATALRLGLNRSVQIEARRLWISRLVFVSDDRWCSVGE